MRQFQSHSQAGQDAFVYHVLGRPRIGSFLDIGCRHPIEINNTYALEKAGMLYGLSVDIDNYLELFQQHRRTRFLQGDASTIDWETVIPGSGLPPQIDYLSMDVDEATIRTLERFPLSKFRFRVITIEHDAYRLGDGPRSKMREILEANGYTLLCSDVLHEGQPFEDWWVDQNRVHAPRIQALYCGHVEGGEIVKRCVMPPSLNDYFDRIICISLKRRHDRWSECLDECKKHRFAIERFEGYDLANDGNTGCTASHRGILELISYNRWGRTLVLEDDFQIRHDDFMDRFCSYWKELPCDWDIVYLGGHYAEKPQSRITEHVIKINRMLTTSSYAITWQFAQHLAPSIFGTAPIDTLFSNHLPMNNAYIFSPRLMVQRAGYSDLQNHHYNNSSCMQDDTHEKMV